MDTAYNAQNLYSPALLGEVSVKNRIVMAPLTRNRAGAGDVPHALNATYYAQRSSAGAIISEATQISPMGIGYPGTPGIYSAAQIAGWKLVTQAVHDQGGKIFLQLWHVGRISHPLTLPNGATPVAPSAIKPAGEIITMQGMRPFVEPRALTVEEIAATVRDFAKGAENAREAGFDGVEVHAANGYLIDQFLRDGSNHRTDQYGGTLENRSRFLREVLEAVCAVWRPQQVGVRLSPVNPFNDMIDSAPQRTFDHVIDVLNPFQLGYLHVVEDRSSSFDFKRLRARFNGAYIANGGYDAQSAEHALESGDADFVAFGRMFIANPDLPIRLKQRGPFNAQDEATFYGGSEKGYTDYPALATKKA